MLEYPACWIFYSVRNGANAAICLKECLKGMKCLMNKEELKRLACEIIDSRHDDIHALGDSIFAEPETGWKEFKTAEKIKKVFANVLNV